MKSIKISYYEIIRRFRAGSEMGRAYVRRDLTHRLADFVDLCTGHESAADDDATTRDRTIVRIEDGRGDPQGARRDFAMSDRIARLFHTIHALQNLLDRVAEAYGAQLFQVELDQAPKVRPWKERHDRARDRASSERHGAASRGAAP